MSPPRLLHFLILLVAWSGCERPRPEGERSWRFPAAGVSAVILRAANAGSTKIEIAADVHEIELRGLPAAVAIGYHTRELSPEQSRPTDWPFEFAARRDSSTLTLASRGETNFPTRRYSLDALTICVPRGVSVRLETQSPADAIAH